MRRVVITGLGAVTPLGNNVKTFFENLLKGKSGITKITRFDPSNLSVQIAAEVKNFHPEEKIDPKTVKRLDRFNRFSLYAAIEAVEDAELNFSKEDPRRIGVLVGSGMGGLEIWEKEHEKFIKFGPKKVSPLLIPMMIPDMASGQISMYYKVRGPNFTTVSACASGANAIGEAFELIKQGKADIMITGGTEAPITAFSISGFANMLALSRRNDEPEKASRPFDRDRDGFVVGEGAGIVILEELEHAQKRGAKIYAEIKGYGTTGDGYHITAPHPEGAGAAEAMEQAIQEAGIPKEDIKYINAHGTSTKLNDEMETKAIKKVFGDYAYKIPVSSSKSMIGHLLGAAGAVEFIATVLCVYHEKVHPTINLENPDPACDLDYVPEGTREMKIKAALTNSFGFGGHNVTLLVTRFEG